MLSTKLQRLQALYILQIEEPKSHQYAHLRSEAPGRVDSLQIPKSYHLRD